MALVRAYMRVGVGACDHMCTCGRVHLRACACKKQDAVIQYGDSLVPEVVESCSVTTTDGQKLLAIKGVSVNDLTE